MVEEKFIIKNQATSILDDADAELRNDLGYFYPKKDLVGLKHDDLVALMEYQLIKAGVSL